MKKHATTSMFIPKNTLNNIVCHKYLNISNLKPSIILSSSKRPNIDKTAI
jgi:hypothetical protein